MEVYRSLKTIPLSHFIEIENTGNLNFLYKKSFDEILEMEINNDNEELKTIFDSFIFEFDKLKLDKIKAESAVLAAQMDILINGKNKQNYRVLLSAEADYKNIAETKEDRTDYAPIIINISRWVGYYIDKHKINAKDFFDLVESYKEYCNELERVRK